jgi:hypothetical protein
VTELILILPTKRLLLVPGEKNVADEDNKTITAKTQQSDAQHRRDHDVVSEKLVGIVQKIT